MSELELPRMAVDVDGVVGNFMKAACKVIVDVTGRPFGPSDWTSWDMIDSANLTQKETDECFRRMHQPGWCRAIETYPGAVEGINRARKVADVAFLTSPMGESPYWAFEREHWLRDLFGAKGRIISTEAKDWCAADALVEDKEKNLTAWLKSNPRGLGLIWSQPYNLTPSPRLRVVRSWDDVLSEFDQHLSRRTV